jgi:hypothetical protein
MHDLSTIYLKDRREIVQGKNICNRCSQNFENEEELEKHTKKEHSNMVKG